MNAILILGALCFAAILFNPKPERSRQWRATVMPLASIIGSGFLVAWPILAHAAGVIAWVAMVGLCLAGYAFGMAVRNNIAHVEPLLQDSPPPLVLWFERASELTLSLAYFVSVAY